MRYLLTLASAVIVIQACYTQTTSVRIALSKTSIKFPAIFPLKPSLDTIDISAIKSRLNLTDCFIMEYHLQPFQYAYNQFLRKEINDNDLDAYIEERKLKHLNYDTCILLKSNVKEAIQFLIGITQDRKIIACPNLNNDRNFTKTNFIELGNIKNGISNDSSFSFHFKNIQMSNHQLVFTINPDITLTVTKTPDSTVDGIINKIKESYNCFNILNDGYKGGLFYVANRRNNIIVNTPIGDNVFNENRLMNHILFSDIKEPISSKTILGQISKGETYDTGDTLFIENSYWIIKNISEYYDSIYLGKIETKKLNGYRRGFYIPNFVGKKFNGETVEYNEQFKSHYLIIDFWGSWCEPCIKLIPEMKKKYCALKRKMQANIQFVSIAYDTKANIPQLKKVIKENKMDWIHLYDDRDIFFTNPTSLIKIFKIGCYPSFILISPEGKILFRGCGKEALGQMDSILHNVH